MVATRKFSIAISDDMAEQVPTGKQKVRHGHVQAGWFPKRARHELDGLVDLFAISSSTYNIKST